MSFKDVQEKKNPYERKKESTSYILLDESVQEDFL
jgi:hypothetical protein